MSGSGWMERPERAAAAPGAQPRANGCSGAAHGGLRNGYVRGLPAPDTQVSAPGASCRPGAAGSGAREEVDGRGEGGQGSARLGSSGRAGQRLCAGLGSERAEGSRRAEGRAGGLWRSPRKFGSRIPGGDLEPGGSAGNGGRAAARVWDAWLSGLAVPVPLGFCGFKLESRSCVTGPCFSRKRQLVP